MGNKTNWWMVVAIVAIVLLLFNGFGYGMMGWGGGYGGYGGMMSWMFGNPFGWVLGFATMIVLWGLAIVILVYFIKMISESLNQRKSSLGEKNGKRKNR
ncbi:MAG: hypothetical protein AABY16_03950 [Nanoarchaeota archaeon]